MFNKVTIKGAKQAVQMFGPAQHAVAKAVADSVADGMIPADEADNLFICVGVFIHWEAADDKKIQDYNYRAVKESIARAVNGRTEGGRGRRQARPGQASVRRRLVLARLCLRPTRHAVGPSLQSMAKGIIQRPGLATPSPRTRGEGRGEGAPPQF